MEILILSVCLVALLCCLTVSAVMAAVVYKAMQTPQPAEQPKPVETPEELEARRAAAEAQRLYEQGFVNLMSYNGSPRKREEREQL